MAADQCRETGRRGRECNSAERMNLADQLAIMLLIVDQTAVPNEPNVQEVPAPTSGSSPRAGDGERFVVSCDKTEEIESVTEDEVPRRFELISAGS